MTRRPFFAFLVIAFVLLLAPTAHADGWKVIVHPNNPVTSISRAKLARFFLKSTTTWDNGNRVLPVDQRVSSSARNGFSRAVHGKTPRAIKNWWNQQIFAGKGVPPPELASDAKVIAYVLSNPGAIGYVDGSASTGDAKTISVGD